jgi:serine/threonine protein kinase
MARMYGKGSEPVPKYRLTQFLGRGDFGEVWKASAPGEVECAIKIILVGGRQGITAFRAVRLVKRIHHANLTPIIAFWLKDEADNILEDADNIDSVRLRGSEAELIVAMGLGDRNLADRLRECKEQGQAGIPGAELLGYLEDAAKAIDFLNQPRHDLGAGPVAIQHCDIKPQNILLVGDSAQVCDFGLARQLNDVRRSALAATTYAYVSPELIAGRPSRTSDQYALAITYAQLRTGALPYRTRSVSEMLGAHLENKLDFSRLPEAEQPILRRATAHNPEDRYPSCTDMVEALREVAAGVAEPEPAPVPVSAEAPPPAAAEEPRPGLEIVPGYRLVELLARAGAGDIWKAAAPGGISVAVRIRRNLRRGSSEGRALELLLRVEHNHLLELHGYWLLDEQGRVIPEALRQRTDAPTPATLIVATKLAGKTVLERLHESQAAQAGSAGIPFRELLTYLRQAAEAIDHLNAPIHPWNGRTVAIRHRDIKPENLLLVADTIKVGSFSLAEIVEGPSASVGGGLAGLTLPYAAPEVLSNRVTAWSDQYSLAVTYFHLRTGRLPFRTTAPTQIFMAHVEGKLDLDALPAPERAVIARATAVNPSERFSDCREMVRALEGAGKAPRGRR